MRYSETMSRNAQEWIELDEAINHVKALPDGTDDELIENMITAAREYCEGITGRAIMGRDMTAFPDSLSGRLFLPKPPIKKIDSITAYDKAGNAHAITEYAFDAKSGEVFIVDAPRIDAREINPYVIKYSAGYDQIPGLMRQAMLLMIGHWYINRESVVVGSNATVDVGLTTKDLLKQFKVWWF